MKSEVLDSSETGGPAPLFRGAFFCCPEWQMEIVKLRGKWLLGFTKFFRFPREFVPVPRPKAGARARINNAKEAEEHGNNRQFEPIGRPNRCSKGWKSSYAWRQYAYSHAD